MRSGDMARWKSTPASRPDERSSIGPMCSRVVPGIGGRLEHDQVARAAGAGAMDSVAALMYERSGSRFSVSGVGTHTMMSSQAATSAKSTVARSRPLRRRAPPSVSERDVLDVGVAGVDAVDARGVGLDAEHGVAGLGEGDGQGQADVAGPDDGDVVHPRRRSVAAAPCGSRHQAAIRAGRVAVAVDLGMARPARRARRRPRRSPRGRRRRARSSRAARSRPTRCVSRRVTHGTECR